ncbi:hypothetical protein PLANPX_4553 [Lacipirellula parvula]|uniref:Uncharacterized protein n=1 Tax=Lacipirellula parvula TaxID=2650471 RepID=A0A5K7XIX8_9BACT|nr:hypothetical protein PLANPX_4553 [Lacipirellula parvula]
MTYELEDEDVIRFQFSTRDSLLATRDLILSFERRVSSCEMGS